MKDSSIDVDEDDWGQGDGQELELPVVGVDDGQCWGEAEQHDDEDQADQQPGLSPEPSYQSYKNKLLSNHSRGAVAQSVERPSKVPV